MPIHDWTRVNPGLLHHFHQSWTIFLTQALNAGALPHGYFALAEQPTAGLVPDVLTRHEPRESSEALSEEGGLAVALSPPRTRYVRHAEADPYLARANRVTIRHLQGDVVAVVEVVSPGNKASRSAFRAFVEKAVGFLRQGVHLLVVDLFPPSPRDPQGSHKAIWDEFVEEPFEPPANKPLTLASYAAGARPGGAITAYVEPVGVGDRLPEMPIFLHPDGYIPAPLESSYQAAWDACPLVLREALRQG